MFGVILLTGFVQQTSCSHFVGFTGLEGFSKEVRGDQAILTSPVIEALPFDEVILSWNGKIAKGCSAKFEVQGVRPDTKFFCLGELKSGQWGSQKGQKDLDGDVLTDTLRFVRPCKNLRVRVTVSSAQGETQPTIEFLGISLFDSHTKPAPDKVTLEQQLLNVPERAQGSFPDGEKICSPTCLSMVMGYWAWQTGRIELDEDVPTVCASVFDPNWPGYGNWSFNVAYAGSFPGMRSFVTRLNNISELEDWIRNRVPVVTSVAYDILRFGARKRPDDGHLLVLVGFTKAGDPIFNNPGDSSEIRKTYSRTDFERAWNESKRTVYLVYPVDHEVPKSLLNDW